MKLVTILLAAAILFLAVKPGMDVLLLQSEADQACCNKPCESAKPHDADNESGCKKNCDNEPCNPFQVCSTCVLDCMIVPFSVSPNLAAFAENKNNPPSVIHSQFTPEFWQPPKIV